MRSAAPRSQDSPSPTPSTTARSGSVAKPLAALAAAALLGGGAALGGAAAVGVFDGSSTTTVVEQTAAGSAVPAVATTGLSINQIYRRSGPGVVQITSTTPGSAQTDVFGQQFQAPPQQALGSGFVLDKEGHIVTNYHVIEGASNIEVRFSNDDTMKATLVGGDPSTDLALLKVGATARALTPLPLGDSDKAQVGDSVVAIGNPFGLERTVTAGIISALQRAVTAPNGFTIDHVIQTDAPINRGNSGGPLLNTRGEVIGVNSQIETGGSGDGNVGVGFAVPVNTVKAVVAQLLAKGKVEHAYLGVAAVEISPAMVRTFRLPVDNGLVVQGVAPGSGAEQAGLRAGNEQVVIAGESFRMGGDVIVAADGKAVTSIAELRDVIAARKPGDRITLKIYRGQDAKTLTVTLGRQPTSPSR
ncbi:Trypsin-like serine proteases typically periplasmic [Gaiella occulta]|uniref:Trypsin-like serine proteases typically periplasmic n=1 Tax=Gaiella occulta TaxID=1002870 RepID=A0A7M2Z1Q2_9ACTN|nr:trypsin-like peptidase domain-containing protein [Gaiella occulta]RDI75732.1 Trypsin-like serine proteases typically periplasmic [Gaiella occulta]